MTVFDLMDTPPRVVGIDSCTDADVDIVTNVDRSIAPEHHIWINRDITSQTNVCINEVNLAHQGKITVRTINSLGKHVFAPCVCHFANHAVDKEYNVHRRRVFICFWNAVSSFFNSVRPSLVLSMATFMIASAIFSGVCSS